MAARNDGTGPRSAGVIIDGLAQAAEARGWGRISVVGPSLFMAFAAWASQIRLASIYGLTHEGPKQR